MTDIMNVNLTCGESHSFVAFCELDIEKCYKSLYVIVPFADQSERCAEGQVIDRNRVHVDFLDEAIIGHHLVRIDNINQRLGDGHTTNATHIEAVHTVPP